MDVIHSEFNIVPLLITIVINSSKVNFSSDSCNGRQAAETNAPLNSTETCTYAAKVGLKHAYTLDYTAYH